MTEPLAPSAVSVGAPIKANSELPKAAPVGNLLSKSLQSPSERVTMLANVVADLMQMAREEIVRLRQAIVSQPEESRLKDILALTKAVQSMDEFSQSLNKAERDLDEGETDILAFREELERKILALVEDGSERAIHSTVDPG